MQLNTEGEGLLAIFREWQVPLLEELHKRDLTSGEAHKLLEDKDIRTTPNARNTVSRASTITFLNGLVDLKLLTYTEYSGKGGWGRKYAMTLTPEEFAHTIIGHFVGQLLLAFPEQGLTFMWPRP